MNDSDNLLRLSPEKQSNQMPEFGLLTLIPMVLRNWYWFLISIMIGLFGARFYLKHTLPVFKTTATVLVSEADDPRMAGNNQLLLGLGLPGGMTNIHNQLMILNSRDLVEKTLKELPFEIEYYFRTYRNRLPIYPETPVKVLSDGEIPLPRDTEFEIVLLGNNAFNLTTGGDYTMLPAPVSFGEDIHLNGGTFRIECLNPGWLAANADKKICFVMNSRRSLTNQYARRVSADLVSREGSTVRLSISGTNPDKDADFINKHIELFRNISLERKNTEAQRRIQFIEDQLVGVSDSLQLTENRLQQFRSSHRVMDLSAQGQAIIAQVTTLENDMARLNLDANYYDYLADYLAKSMPGEMPVIPVTMGITDPGLTRLVEELATLQGQLSVRGAGELNPLQRNLEQKIRTTKETLRETLNGLIRANALARSEKQGQINRANTQATTLPVTERQLLGIERKFRVNDELYTYLLETRAEQLMQKASNRSDSEVIDAADSRFSVQVAPNSMMILLVGFFAGFFIPLMIIILKHIFNNKLGDEDIKTFTGLPVVGNIPHNAGGSNVVVFEDSGSTVSEAFRLLRSRMQFFTTEKGSAVILVTSTLPGDGKTFTAINLSSVYSLLGKKTVLVGFDLRKPKIFQDFNLKNEKGISTWLIGRDKLEEIIQPTGYDNLSVIAAGPVPPNPSELTAMEKTRDLIAGLRERYDYIVIDSSPIGLVSDAYHLASLADACLMVVRPGVTLRDMFYQTAKELASSQAHGVSLVINDIQNRRQQYGYGERYGYTVSNRKSNKGFRKYIQKKTTARRDNNQ